MVKRRRNHPPGTAPRPPGGARRRLPAGERRLSILVRSLPLFAARGLDGTTTRDLARASRIAEPILYRHFPSKEDLFLAILDLVEQRILDRLEELIAGRPDVSSRVAALAEGLPGLLGARRDEFRVLNGAAATQGDEKIAARVREAYAHLGEFLSAAVGAGGLRAGLDAATAGHLLLEVGLGASLTRLAGVPAVLRDGYGEAALQLVLSALTSTGNRRRPRRGRGTAPPR